MVRLLYQKIKKICFIRRILRMFIRKRKLAGIIVKMLLKEDPVCLRWSREIALKKFRFLWNHLIKNPEFLSLYSKFMRGYLELSTCMKFRKLRKKKNHITFLI